MTEKIADAGGFGGDAYPGEEPDAEQLRRDYTDTTKTYADPEQRIWSFVDGKIKVGHDEENPQATGTMEIHNNWYVDFKVQSSEIAIKILAKALKGYARENGLKLHQIQDAVGNPIPWKKQADYPGIGEQNPGVKDWMQKEWSQEDMTGDYYGFQDPTDDSSLDFNDKAVKCHRCGKEFANESDWLLHQMYGHEAGTNEPSDSSPDPVVNLDDQLPAGYDEASRGWGKEPGINTGSVRQSVERRDPVTDAIHGWADGYEGDDAIRIPFFYTINKETGDVMVRWMGTPGSWHDDSVERDSRGSGISLNAGEVVFSNFDSPIVHFANWAGNHPLSDYAGLSMKARKMMLDFKRAIKNNGDVKIWRGDSWSPDAIGGREWEKRVRQPGWGESMRLSAEQIPGPIPWLYDPHTARIYVGHPGDPQETMQQYLPGYDPFNVVEGQYLPSGEMIIHETTNLPVTVRYLIQLWYYMHPELEVKRVTIEYTDMGGKVRKERLAAEDVIHSKINQVLASDPAAYTAALALMKHGNMYVVGGAIRDIALGKTPKDVDLMVQGVSEKKLDSVLNSLPGRVDMTGKNFGVYRYRNPDGYEVEIALPRTERSTGPGHKDFEVITDPHIKVDEDLLRRDFTANAMAYDLNRSQLIDPHGGWDDLQNGVMRTVNRNSFRDDPLRILRGLGMHSRHGLVPDEQTRLEMKKHGPNLAHLPAERVQEEMDKLIKGRNPVSALRLAQETGTLQHFLPEVAKLYGFDQQNKHHNLDLFDHTMSVLDHLTRNTEDPDLRYMGLLHDIGKPESKWVDDEGWAHYYENERGEGKDHETHGANMAEAALKRLKFPTARTERIKHLVQHHMFVPFNTQKGARRFLNKVGPEHSDDLLHMREADLAGKDHRLDDVNAMRGLVNDVKSQGQAFNKENLAINGKDLIGIGIKPGPSMGQLFNQLVDMVVDNPALNTRDKLLQIAYELNGNA
jgi:tRNA nucleotidyltransferase (CCA-adding enzyme)